MTINADAGAPADRFFEPEIETASREEITALQEKRILDLVPYAWERSAFYRELWSRAGLDPTSVRSMADFVEKVPTFCKDDLREYRSRTGDPFAGLLCVDRSDLTSITSTSGSTGAPEPIPEIWDVAPPLPNIYARDLWCLGLRPGDRVMAPSGTFRNYFDPLWEALGLVPVFVDGWIGQGEQVLEAIEKYEVSYVQLFLPTVLEWEKLEGKHDIRQMVSSLKGASFAGMPLGKALSAKVRDEWGLNLFTYTSAGDTGTAWEGVEHDGFHLWEDTIFAETLDPVSGKPVGDDELGELISTDLDNVAAPYIRFRTSDLVRMNRGAAPSGRTHARMWVVGRTGDEMSIAGKAVVLADVWEQVESLPEFRDAMFQVVYDGPSDRMRIRLGYTPGDITSADELHARATSLLENGLGVPIDAELIDAGDLLARSKSVAKFSRKVTA